MALKGILVALDIACYIFIPFMNYYNLLLYSNIIAFTIAEAAGLPPFLPMLEINGISIFLNSSLDSAAETNPTGIPTISAGFVTFSLTIFIISYKAVGALPMATIPPLISSAAYHIYIGDDITFVFNSIEC